MNRNRLSDNLKALLTCSVVSGDSEQPCRIPSLAAVCGNASNPIRRIWAGEILHFVGITAGTRTKFAFVVFDAGVPRLSLKRRAALFTDKRDRLNPIQAANASNLLGFEPRRIVPGWLACAIHALGIFDTGAMARAKTLAGHSAWRHQHNLTALLTWLLLSHIFAHVKIITHFGSGTTGEVAQSLGRQWIGCDLQRDYEAMQKQRTAQTGMVLV